ncbi:MAG: hypothetical protein KAJ35_04380, partial [Thermoplasmata archaeon]|nr:hypothetical protein [Thermoplasmata archaeon]
DLANRWIEHVSATVWLTMVDGTPDGGDDQVGVSGGAAIGLSLLVLLMIPVVFVVWRRRARRR